VALGRSSVFFPACKLVIRCVSATEGYNSFVQAGSQGWASVGWASVGQALPGVPTAQVSVVDPLQIEPDGRESGSLTSDDANEQEITSWVIITV